MTHPAFDDHLRAVLDAAMSAGTKLSVFDDQMRLVWFSPDWMDVGGAMANPTEPLGRKWLEFVHPDDLPAAHAWIAAGDGATVEMRCLDGTAGRWLDVVMTKRRIGHWWVAAGDNSFHPPA